MKILNPTFYLEGGMFMVVHVRVCMSMRAVAMSVVMVVVLFIV